MSDYEKLKQELEALRNKCKELEDKIEQAEHDDEPRFERREGKLYYWVSTNNGKAERVASTDDAGRYDKPWYDNNNYFYTAERAQEVADKINFLLKLERYHDIYCSDYVPDWRNYTECKNAIIYNHKEERYEVQAYNFIRQTASVYFSSWKIAQKVCDILNKEKISSQPVMIEF
jgi:hypothetical protein